MLQPSRIFKKTVVAVTIKTYGESVDDTDIISAIMASCLPCLPSLINGLSNNFTGLESVNWYQLSLSVLAFILSSLRSIHRNREYISYFCSIPNGNPASDSVN